MAGIYIHYPFCKQACHYCNFHFSTSQNLRNDFLHALLKEIVLQKNYLQGEPVETIYIGGGTPSLLLNDEIARIIDSLFSQFLISPAPEITLEANPDDITVEKLNCWKQHRVNRLSIGVQSFFESDLKWMNRVHTVEQAIASIKMAQNAGFDNITIDLIFGMPHLSDGSWKQNVETAIDLQIPHLSCYALTVEPQTALDAMIKKNKIQTIKSDDQARQFLLLMDLMDSAGFEQYEISNYAKPGYRSKHNSSYWQGKKYLGLGPSAHSYNGAERQWNISNNPLYIQSLLRNNLNFEKEELTLVQKANEWIMTSLRTVEGLDTQSPFINFSEDAAEKIKEKSKKFIQRGMIFQDKEVLKLTTQGKLFADGIAAEMFF